MAISFAHRGGRAHEPENSLAAFQSALRRGADGLESDVRVTTDGELVLVHDARVRSGLRRLQVATTPMARLEHAGVVRLQELYERCGTDFELSLDVKDPAAAEPTIELARDHDVVDRLWLCSPDDRFLAELRSTHPDVRLVHSVRVSRIRVPLERHAADLTAAGIDAINLHQSEWTGGLVALFHRFGRLAFGWDAQESRQLDTLLRMKIDAVYSDHVDRMVQAIRAWEGAGRESEERGPGG
jgi:glycerophosphoryl diester phosphodiesterase